MFASGCQRLASWARVGQACRGMARGLSSSMPPGEGKGLVRPDRERGLFALLGEGACSPETEPQMVRPTLHMLHLSKLSQTACVAGQPQMVLPASARS